MSSVTQIGQNPAASHSVWSNALAEFIRIPARAQRWRQFGRMIVCALSLAGLRSLYPPAVR